MKMKFLRTSAAAAIIAGTLAGFGKQVLAAPGPPVACQNDKACMSKHFPHGVLRAPKPAAVADKDIDKHICATLSKSDRAILHATMLHLMPTNRTNVAVVLGNGRVLSNRCGKPPVEICKMVKGTHNTVRCPGGRTFPSPE